MESLSGLVGKYQPVAQVFSARIKLAVTSIMRQSGTPEMKVQFDHISGSQNPPPLA